MRNPTLSTAVTVLVDGEPTAHSGAINEAEANLVARLFGVDRAEVNRLILSERLARSKRRARAEAEREYGACQCEACTSGDGH